MPELPAAALARREALRVPPFPPPGTVCMWRAGACGTDALPGRWVCAKHADRLELLGQWYAASTRRRAFAPPSASARSSTGSLASR